MVKKHANVQFSDVLMEPLIHIYILDVFTEKAFSKPVERNVVYIPITTLKLTCKSDVLGSIPGLATYFHFSFR